MALNEIQQRVKKYPNDVHKMPIERGVLDGRVIGTGKLLPAREPRHNRNDNHSDRDMNGVHASHDPIKDPENLRLGRKARL